MRFARVASFVVGLSLASAALPQEGFAQEASAQDIAQARQLAQQAATAYDAGKYDEAEKLYAAAAKLYPVAPTLHLGLARSQAKLGHFVAAQENYNKIIRENISTTQAFKDAVEAAKAEVGALAPKIATVVITVEGATNANVTIDGVPVNAAALGLKRPVDPGQHVVKATADGMKPAESTFQVAEGGTAEAQLKLEKDPNAVAVAPVPGQPQPGDSRPSPLEEKKSPNKTIAIVAYGIGGAGLVLGAVTGLMAVGKHGDLESSCPDGKCNASFQGDVDSYQTMGTLSTVGFVVFGVGAVVGTVFLVTAPKSGSASATRKSSPYIGLGGAGIYGQF